jgi:hypothetical protein
MSAKKVKKVSAPKWHFPLERKNLIIIGIGIATILLGYILMSLGIGDEPAYVDGKWNNVLSVSIAPLILVIGYCVIIPYGIYRTFATGKTENTAE